MTPPKEFSFQHFDIQSCEQTFQPGTDAVILGAWTPLPDRCSVLDLGVGTGIVGLMLAQRHPHVTITGIDIHNNAVVDANTNFQKSPWSSRLTAYLEDFKTYHPTSSFDVIVSNPPFFTNGVRSPNKSRAAARHVDQLGFEQLLQHGFDILTEKGELIVILPESARSRFVNQALNVGFHLKCDLAISSFQNGPVVRRILHLSKVASKTKWEHLTIYRAKKVYSTEFKNLTAAFYL